MSPIPNREAPDVTGALHTQDGWEGLRRYIREERRCDSKKITYAEALRLLLNTDLPTERLLGMERAAEVAL